MDERVFLYKAGAPIPEWDLRHRLPINRPVGPVCQDTATIFRINSTFMDVTDQPYMERQGTAIAALILAFTAALFVGLAGLLISLSKFGFEEGSLFVFGMFSPMICGFGYFAWRLGREEFFSLTRRPIRFNREEKKIYAIRRRRYFANAGEGDVTWEAPWNAQSIFCVHSSGRAGLVSYHIRCYTVDDQGNVLRAFAIGRVWHGDSSLPYLLSQWNYWCAYMNEGPERLPKPALFFSENESLAESFLFCLYSLCGTGGVVARIVLMPLIILLAGVRSFAMWTCRAPVWPKEVTAVSLVALDDAFNQPRGETPVGWGATAVAREGGVWPREEILREELWRGESDTLKNGLLWAESTAPPIS